MQNVHDINSFIQLINLSFDVLLLDRLDYPGFHVLYP